MSPRGQRKASVWVRAVVFWSTGTPERE
jgi:hypothetical protein